VIAHTWLPVAWNETDARMLCLREEEKSGVTGNQRMDPSSPG
jgi:hypothetical protein